MTSVIVEFLSKRRRVLLRLFLLTAVGYVGYVSAFWNAGWEQPHGNPLPFLEASVPWSIPWLSYVSYPRFLSAEVLLGMHVAVVALGIALNAILLTAVIWFAVFYARLRVKALARAQDHDV